MSADPGMRSHSTHTSAGRGKLRLDILVTEIWPALGHIRCSDTVHRHNPEHEVVLHNRNHRFGALGYALEADRTAVDIPALECGDLVAGSGRMQRLHRTLAIGLVVFLAIELETCHGNPVPSAHTGHHTGQGCFEEVAVNQRWRRSRSGIPLESRSYPQLASAEQESGLVISWHLPWLPLLQLLLRPWLQTRMNSRHYHYDSVGPFPYPRASLASPSLQHVRYSLLPRSACSATRLH